MPIQQFDTQNTILESRTPSTATFVKALIGLIAGLFAGMISLILVFLHVTALSTSNTDTAAIGMLAFAALTVYAAPVYWPLFIAAVILCKKSIKNRERKLLRVMGWTGLLFALIAAATYFIVVLVV
jgi:hypothetical protein